MIAEGTDAAAVTEEQIKTVAQDVEVFRQLHKIGKNQIASALGMSAGVIVEFLKGTYRGNKAQVAIDLDAWLVEEEQRRSRPATTQFVWTNVAQEIKGVANYALDKRTISLVYGPDTSGMGKTTALQAIHREMGARRSALLTIDKVDANPTGLLIKLCAAVGKDRSGSNRVRFTRVVEALKGQGDVGRSFVLLIDQVHNLREAKGDKPLYILADLYDATKAAQLWCGTADMLGYLERQQSRQGDESLAQIRRRIFPRVDLMASLRAGGGDGGEPLVTVDQVREMFAKNKLKIQTTATRFLCRLCNEPDTGGVGVCVQLVEYATMLGELRNVSSIDLPLLQEAMRRGFPPARAEMLLAQAQVEPMRQARTG